MLYLHPLLWFYSLPSGLWTTVGLKGLPRKLHVTPNPTSVTDSLVDCLSMDWPIFWSLDLSHWGPHHRVWSFKSHFYIGLLHSPTWGFAAAWEWRFQHNRRLYPLSASLLVWCIYSTNIHSPPSPTWPCARNWVRQTYSLPPWSLQCKGMIDKEQSNYIFKAFYKRKRPGAREAVTEYRKHSLVLLEYVQGSHKARKDDLGQKVILWDASLKVCYFNK